MLHPDLENSLRQTQLELASVKRVVGTLITWIGQSAASPISHAEVKQLLEMLPPEK